MRDRPGDIVRTRFFKLVLLRPDYMPQLINPGSTRAPLWEARVGAPVRSVEALVAALVWSVGARIAAVAWSIASPAPRGAVAAQWSLHRPGQPVWRRAYR